jgi:hypothetical protein
VFARAGSLIGQWLPEIVPRFFSVATLAAGALLLVSGSTPAEPARLALLNLMLPLPVVELSHLLGSVVGVGLLLLARAVQQRVDAGYALTLALLFGGAGFSLLKGLDWEEASVLLLMGIALAPCRRFFYRRSSLFAQSFTPAWTVGIAGSCRHAHVVLLANGTSVLGRPLVAVRARSRRARSLRARSRAGACCSPRSCSRACCGPRARPRCRPSRRCSSRSRRSSMPRRPPVRIWRCSATSASCSTSRAADS